LFRHSRAFGYWLRHEWFGPLVTADRGDGLATVQSVLGQDPFSGTIFVFRSKRADRVKMLVYDGTGLVLIWKRLEGSNSNGRRSATG
jgi:IS66 Orf2 like protein